MKPSQEISEIIPDVRQKQGLEPGPAITVLGGIHGDETAGVLVANQLLLYLVMNEVRKGILNIGYGNPKAIKAGKRYVTKDLNRCFGQSPIVKNIEEARANLLTRVLSETDILLDVHSTIKPSKPFVCVPNLHHPGAQYLPLLGISTIVTGEGLLPPDKTPIYTDTFVCAKGGTPQGFVEGGFGVTIETGWQKEQNRVKSIRTGILRMFQTLGILSEAVKHPLLLDDESLMHEEETTSRFEYWDAYWNVVAGKDFAFTKEFGNFDVLKPDTHFATSDGNPFVTPERSIILFPKPPEKIVHGQEACIIAREIKSGE